MKTKLLLILLLLGLQLNLNAQAKHDYKPNCCRLAGAKFTMEKSCYCAGCAEVDEKNRQAKEAEDQRVKAVIAKKEEEKRQKAIADQKKQNEKLAEQRKKDKGNVLHLGFPKTEKNTPKPEVKKDKITTDKRFQLQTNERDGKAGFDDANGEPILYSDAYKYTKVQDYLPRAIYPIGYGVVYFKDGSVDVVDYKGKRYLNDKTINEVFYVCDNWYLALEDIKDKGWSNYSYIFKSAYFINISTNEKVSVPIEGLFHKKNTGYATGSATRMKAGFDAVVINTDNPYEDIGKNFENSKEWKMRLLFSDFLGKDVKEWKAMVIFWDNNFNIDVYYYIDKRNKIIKFDSSMSLYDVKRKYEEKYGSLWW